MHRCHAVCCLGNICKHGKLVLLLFNALNISAKKNKQYYTFMMEFSLCLFPLIIEENTEYISYIYFYYKASGCTEQVNF